MKLTQKQDDHYAQMRYHTEIKRQDAIATIIAQSPYAKNRRHVAAHKRRENANYAECRHCVSAAANGYYVPVLNPEGW